MFVFVFVCVCVCVCVNVCVCGRRPSLRHASYFIQHRLDCKCFLLFPFRLFGNHKYVYMFVSNSSSCPTVSLAS